MVGKQYERVNGFVICVETLKALFLSLKQQKIVQNITSMQSLVLL